jgi:hypothetical protein
MTKFEDVAAAVERLSPEELEKFRAWFEELRARQWDEKIESDLKAGKLDKHTAKWRADYQAGKFTDL